MGTTRLSSPPHEAIIFLPAMYATIMRPIPPSQSDRTTFPQSIPKNFQAPSIISPISIFIFQAKTLTVNGIAPDQVGGFPAKRLRLSFPRHGSGHSAFDSPGGWGRGRLYAVSVARSYMKNCAGGVVRWWSTGKCPAEVAHHHT